MRYHGGKWKLAPWIISHFPAHRVYVEAFGGAGSVLLRKPRCHAEVYNDLDGEIVNLFRVVRDRGSELRRALELTPFARAEFDSAWEKASDPLEQARRTVVRAAMGRDAASATMHRKCSFRIHTGSRTRPATTMQDWSNYPNAMDAIIQRLQGVAIENRDALSVMKSQDGDEVLHYVDPPYVTSTRPTYPDYRHELDDSQHVALIEFLRTLRGKVVLSGYDCDLYQQILKGWTKIESKAFADGGNERTEAIWLSPNCPAAGLFEVAA